MSANNDNPGLRTGAYALVLRCMEPALCTPEATTLIDKFVMDSLHDVNVNVDKSNKPDDDHGVLLKGELALPGLLRNYALGNPSMSDAIRSGLSIAVNSHGIELIILLEHTDCGERALWFKNGLSQDLTATKERADIESSLLGSEKQIRRQGFEITCGSRPIHVICAVGIVTKTHDVTERRLLRIVTLEEFLA